MTGRRALAGEESIDRLLEVVSDGGGDVDHMRLFAIVVSPTVRAVEAQERPEGFVAPGHAGLETFPNPGVSQVEMTSDEVAAICPLTGQPDLYVATIDYRPRGLCLESKSLKLYLAGYRNDDHFCEALAVKIRDDVAQALDLPADDVRVTLRQKPRGGITITATA